MSIKTEQLCHSLHQLDQQIETLSQGKHNISEHDFRNKIDDILEANRDSLNIIYSILTETN